MLRPPRRKKRFQGQSEAAGATNLSNPSEEADGRKKRRRMALAFAGCALLIALIIALAVGGKNDASSASGSSGTQAASKANFLLTSHAALAEVQSDVEFYKHRKSGLQVMTMIPKDTTQDATFGISFRTPPNNDRGTAQVVRNSILSGSQKYPVKDPFNQLKRGSLQTFLETWTGNDRTAFVVASRNKADFGNAIKVFLDGVFHPLMSNGVNQWIFRQAGWRLEVVEVDGYRDLTISGNAFIEAKAVAMYPATTMENFLYKKLFPDNAYGFNPHGDTAEVVVLTESEVINYYAAHYHPSNGQAFCYGPRDYVDQCLDLLDSVVSVFDENIQLRVDSKVGWQELLKLENPHEAVPYPSLYHNSTDFRYAKSWVLNDQNMDSRTEVAWFLISDLLVGSPAALLSKVVADLNLGDDVIGGLDQSLQQWRFTVGVSGIADEAKVVVAQDAIRDLLLQTAEEGFKIEAMTASLNKVDMNLREQSACDEPLGVKHFKAILNKWTYDFDAKLPLLYSKVFAQLKEEIEKDGQGFILQLITKSLVDNNHQTQVEMFPSVKLAKSWEKRETEWLNKLDDYVDKEEGLQMLNETNQMKKKQAQQDSESDLAKIPRVSISDLNKTSFEIPVKEDRDIFDSGLTMLEHQLPHTNGIAYVDFAIDISNMDFNDVVLLPLFCRLMLEGGTARMNDVQFQRDIETYTGGIEVFPVVDEIIETNSDGSYIVPDGKHLVTKIVVRTSCLAAKGGLGMFNIIKQIIFDTDVQNEEQAKDIMQRLIDDMEDDIQTNGHKYTTLRIKSRYSLPGFVAEQWKGITQLMNLRRALAISQTDFDSVGKRLILMQDAMKRGNRNGMLLGVTGDHDAIKGIAYSIQIFVKDTLPPAAQVTRFPDFAKTAHPWVTKGLTSMEAEIQGEDPNEAFIVPTFVNHVGKGGILFDVGEALGGEDAVVMQFLGGYYLYDRVRFNLGASQAWAELDADSGVVVYQSDRDPNIVETLKVYEKGASWLWEQLNRKSELPIEAKSAVVGTIGTIDGTALQPSQAGYISMLQYLKQDKQAYRQKYRDEVLAAKPEDFIAMVERLGAWGKPSIVVVTNTDQYNIAQKKGYNMTTCDYADYSCKG